MLVTCASLSAFHLFYLFLWPFFFQVPRRNICRASLMSNICLLFHFKSSGLRSTMQWQRWSQSLFFSRALVRCRMNFIRCEIGVVAFGTGLGVGRSRLSCPLVAPRVGYLSPLCPLPPPSMSLSCAQVPHTSSPSTLHKKRRRVVAPLSNRLLTNKFSPVLSSSPPWLHLA